MENKKLKYVINDNYSYKEYNIKIGTIIYYLRIEISKNNINLIAKEFNTPLDYNYKNKFKLISLMKKIKISEKDCLNIDLIFTKLDDIFENNISIDISDNNMIIKIIINNDNSNISENNNYEEIKLNRENMNYDDKLNIIYNHIRMLNCTNCANNSDNKVNNISEIKKIEQSLNKKEDDIKNIINENIEKINNDQKIFI